MSESTINGLPLLRATVTLPRCGVWTADVEAQSGETLSGDVTIELQGLRLVGTIEDGAPYRERGWYRVLGGKGGWRSVLPARAYRNEAGVKLTTVVNDAAREAGESVGTFAERRIGPGFVRPRAEAARVLDLLTPDAWYVDPSGVTQIGSWPVVPYGLTYQLIDSRPDRKRVTLAAEDLTGLVPGATLEGMEAASVRHELTPDGIRSQVYGTVGNVDRILRGLKALVGVLVHSTFYFGRYEYRVVDASDTHCDLVPARAALGLPDLANVVMRSGVPGAGGSPAVGSSCEVMFLDGDPTRPVVVGYEVGEDDAQGRVLRDGDLIDLANFVAGSNPVTATGIGIINLHASLVAPGPPGTGYSRTKT